MWEDTTRNELPITVWLNNVEIDALANDEYFFSKEFVQKCKFV
jgi:hypothetical protein